MKLFSLLALALIIIIAVSWFSNPGINPKNILRLSENKTGTFNPLTEIKLKQKAAAARSFVLQKGYNNKICFFIDMSLSSGQNRFFIYNLEKDSLLNAGLVAHGNCFQEWLEGRKYSNVVGCGCTSLGRYRIGYSYTGKFGYSYKLYGLDSTNDNAFERTVVLHSHNCIPDSAIPDEICQSNGCPMISPSFLEYLKPIINDSKKPVLLWIYE